MALLCRIWLLIACWICTQASLPAALLHPPSHAIFMYTAPEPPPPLAGLMKNNFHVHTRAHTRTSFLNDNS
ncbi:hypothetical protein T492DRAFT_942154 [Pavlovales sp. CCMP2436]|nr:hypothetical protein T492DRAFT_942154 [Pavlovales sp. CCMP2436]